MRDLQRTAERARHKAERAQRDAEQLARGMVLKIVARRFGDAPASLAERLGDVTDPGQLDLLADAALAEGSLEMFLQLVDGMAHP